jgi:glycosyltransferase involved in cell wall biosynthesis
MDRAGTRQRSVSVVIPVLNEGGCIDGLVERLRSSLTKSDVDWDLLFVDDGSTQMGHAS